MLESIILTLTLIYDLFRYNPLLLGLLIGVVRNIGGYASACIQAGKLVAYEKKKLLETLVLYETFFIAFLAVGNLPEIWAIGIAVALDGLRSLKKTIEESNGNIK